MGDGSANFHFISSDASDASSHTETLNPKISNVTSLAFNQSIAYLIVLSDSFGFGGDSIEDGNKPSISHLGGNKNDSAGPATGNNEVGSSSLDLVETHREKPRTCILINSFKSLKGQEPSVKEVRDHLNF